MQIEPLEPSTSVLVSAPLDIPEYYIRMYCEDCGVVKEIQNKGNGKFVVSYSDNTGMHSLYSRIVNIVMYKNKVHYCKVQIIIRVS